MNLASNYNLKLINLRPGDKVKIIGYLRTLDYLLRNEQEAIAIGKVVTIDSEEKTCDFIDQEECSCRTQGKASIVKTPASRYGIILCACRLADPVSGKEYY